MSKRNIVNFVIAGLFAGAAAAHAQSSTFPLAAENGPFQRYEQSIAVEAKTGAAAPVYPQAEIQTYVATDDDLRLAHSSLANSRTMRRSTRLAYSRSRSQSDEQEHLGASAKAAVSHSAKRVGWISVSVASVIT